mmetsp:Transcript_113905/g.368557  ORF Transcript_113905/g.368557 Transcript_113905/m.368557 type:complete len:219 (-) Transcript_113905:64-720(-)
MLPQGLACRFADLPVAVREALGDGTEVRLRGLTKVPEDLASHRASNRFARIQQWRHKRGHRLPSGLAMLPQGLARRSSDFFVAVREKLGDGTEVRLHGLSKLPEQLAHSSPDACLAMIVQQLLAVLDVFVRNEERNDMHRNHSTVVLSAFARKGLRECCFATSALSNDPLLVGASATAAQRRLGELEQTLLSGIDVAVLELFGKLRCLRLCNRFHIQT